MFLATFVVTVIEAQKDDDGIETGKTDVSYTEVGSVEIGETDILRALKLARVQANAIVDALRPRFPKMSYKDCQIHIRPSSTQLHLFEGWKTVTRPANHDVVLVPRADDFVLIDDPRRPTLLSLNTSTAPFAPGAIVG